jgi:hypothetical protein
LLLAIMLIPFAVHASSIDLSTLSFSELVALQNEVFAAIVNHEEFKEVKVPIGVYRVGTDIPAGEYSLKPGDSYAAITLSTNDDFSDYSSMISIASIDEEGIGRIVLKDGQFVNVEYGSIIFARFVGLGF